MPPDKVRLVGEPVAIVVAESIYQAEDAAELLEIAYARARMARDPGGRSRRRDKNTFGSTID